MLSGPLGSVDRRDGARGAALIGPRRAAPGRNLSVPASQLFVFSNNATLENSRWRQYRNFNPPYGSRGPFLKLELAKNV
jgi:hypothetical protein